MEALVGLSVAIIIWLRWSRYYINKQISTSLEEVREDKNYRARVIFTEYLRYFNLDIKSSENSVNVLYKNKNITIIKDEKESVLIIAKKDISSNTQE